LWNAVAGDGLATLDELVEQGVALLAAIGDAGNSRTGGGTHTLRDASPARKRALALSEANSGDGLDAFSAVISRTLQRGRHCARPSRDHLHATNPGARPTVTTEARAGRCGAVRTR